MTTPQVTPARLFNGRWLVLVILAAGLVSAGPRAQSAIVTSTLVDTRALLSALETLSSDAMEGRAAGTAGGARARAFLLEQFRASGLQPVGGTFEHAFPLPPAASATETRKSGVNVIGLIPGTRAPARFIVLSAHYDHVGRRNGQIFNGANDNASGAAALAVIAAYFVGHPLEQSLLVAAFDAEEAGLLGSRAFVANAPVSRDALLVNVNADMIGRDVSETLYVAGARRFPFLAPPIAQAVAASRVRMVMGHDDPAGAGDDWTRDSDQYAFIEAGIPALYVGVEDYQYIHKPNDDVDTMMPAFYVRSVEALIHLVRALDRAAADIAAAAPR